LGKAFLSRTCGGRGFFHRLLFGSELLLKFCFTRLCRPELQMQVLEQCGQMPAFGSIKLPQKLTKFLLQCLEPTSLCSLTPQRINPRLDLRNNIENASEVRFCGLKTSFGSTLASTEFRNACRLLDQAAAVRRLG